MDANAAPPIRPIWTLPNATAHAAADAHVNAARTVPTLRRNASGIAWMLMLLRGRHGSVLQVDANAAAPPIRPI